MSKKVIILERREKKRKKEVLERDGDSFKMKLE